MQPDVGHRSLRGGRCSLPGQLYIVTFVTEGRVRHFDDFDVAVRTAHALVERRIWRDSELACWVLMPDHAHLLVELGGSETLSALVNRVKAVTAKAVNAGNGTAGRVWARAFHDRALRHEDNVVTVARYIVANPLRAGLVRRIADWPFWDAIWL